MKPLITSIALLLCLCSNAQTVSKLDAAKILARSSSKLILIDFAAEWCGPCKLMDAQFWNKEEYQNITKRFIVVKIDVDDDKATALHYGVEGIPNIKIVDAEGEELYNVVGYKGADEMGKQLVGFPESVGELYDAILFEQKGKPTAEECLYVASSYQTILQRADGEAKDAFLKKSYEYFKKCKKNNPPDSIAQKADLGNAFNYVLENKPQKAVNEIILEKVNTENKAFALYIIARAYRDLKDKANAEKHLALLEGLKDDQWQPLVVSIRKSLE